MKHLWFRLLFSLTAFAVGIFSFCYFFSIKHEPDSSPQEHSSSRNGMICINNLVMPSFRLNKQVTMSFDVQEGLLSPSKPLIFCNQVKSVLTYNGTDSGTFSTPHMIIDRDQKTVAFPAEIEMNFFTMTIRGEDAFYDITKQEGVIKKNACGQHALGCFKTGTLTFNTHEQMVIMDDGVQSEFFISRDKQPQQ